MEQRAFTCTRCGSAGLCGPIGRIPSYCPPCRAVRDRELSHEKAARWRARNPEAVDRANKSPRPGRTRSPRVQRYSSLKYRFGITQADYERMLAKQDGRCAACGEPPPEDKHLHVDHDHACCTGDKTCGDCVRGLLCGSCNRGLGLLKDSPEILRRAAAYLDAA